MKKNIMQIQVFTDPECGDICIEQDGVLGEPDYFIIVDPAQVPLMKEHLDMGVKELGAVKDKRPKRVVL